MESGTLPTVRTFFLRWVLATIIGSFIGIFAVILLDETGEFAGVLNQSPVGIGMGLTVGFFQWRVARKWFHATSQWMWASLVGMGIPFVIYDLITVFGGSIPFLVGHDYLTLYFNIAWGGLIVGVWQRGILHPRTSRANIWIIACMAGWMLALLTINLIMIPGHPETSLGMLRNVCAIPIGGAVLSMVTGGTLIWMLQSGR